MRRFELKIFSGRKKSNLSSSSSAPEEDRVPARSVSGDGDDRRPGSAYPIRPYADDCPFYMRNGTCKFGSACRFNHPPKRANLRAVKEMEEKEKERERDEIGGKEGTQFQQMQCKYFLGPGGCKFGDACKYKHSFDDPEEVQTNELNFIGLPIRPGEKECPYYMRHGACAYGAICKFHHPDPTPNGDFDPQDPTLNDGTFPLMPSGGYIGETSDDVLQQSGPMHAQEFWPTQTPPDHNDFHYQRGSSSYVPNEFYPGSPSHQDYQNPGWKAYQPGSSSHQGGYQNPGWNAYKPQVPNYPLPTSTLYHHSGAASSSNVMTEGQSSAAAAVEHRNSNSIYAGRIHCKLNDKGLPLRPDQKVCKNYRRLRLCKHGAACPFHHPEMPRLSPRVTTRS